MERYRIVFEVSENTRKRYDKCIKPLGHGVASAFMSTIVDEILDCVEENPRAVVGYILNKKIHLLDIAPTIKEAVEEKKVDVKRVRNAVKEREL